MYKKIKEDKNDEGGGRERGEREREGKKRGGYESLSATLKSFNKVTVSRFVTCEAAGGGVGWGCGCEGGWGSCCCGERAGGDANLIQIKDYLRSLLSSLALLPLPLLSYIICSLSLPSSLFEDTSERQTAASE